MNNYIEQLQEMGKVVVDDLSFTQIENLQNKLAKLGIETTLVSADRDYLIKD